jgi:hypothetical protein
MARAPRRWLAWLAGLAAVALVAVAASGGCALSRAGGVGTQCTVVADCEDDNPCTSKSCSAEGFCELTPQDGGAQIIQVPYDCKALTCQDGRRVELTDDGDLPTNPCIEASCQDGVLDAMNKADNAPCELGQGTGSCQGGECAISCDPNNPVECNDGNECTIDSCDAITALCAREDIDQQPATGNVTGDCKLQLCVQGQVQDLVDDNDTPDDGEFCTADSCDNGAPVRTPVAAGTECGTGDPVPICNDVGQCVGCNDPTDCGGMDTACQTITCESQVCGVLNQPDGTVVTSSNPCQNEVCNGMGGTRINVFADDTACDDSVFCNGTDQCLNGQCNKHSGDSCPGPNGNNNCAESCNENGMSCDAPDPLGSPCDYMSMMLPGECDANGSCTLCGVDVLGPGTGNCPNACDSCMTTIAGETCLIDCTNTQECKGLTINCPNNYACEITCGGTQGCQAANINCPAGNLHCGVTCITGTDPCKNANVNCGADGSCDMLCGSGDRCKGATLTCGNDACGAVCAGDPVSVVCGNACACQQC